MKNDFLQIISIAIFSLVFSLCPQYAEGYPSKNIQEDEPKGEVFTDQIHFSIISNTSVTFNWVGTADKLYYGFDSTNLVNSIYSTDPGFLPVTSPWLSDSGPYNEAKITGLIENSKYFYKVGINGLVKSFNTPPIRGSSGFRICSISDMHETSNASKAIFNQIVDLQPDMVITTGDLTGAGPRGQQEVSNRFRDAMVWSQTVAWMPCIGNHDWEYTDFDDLRTYKGRFDIPNPGTSISSPEISCCGEDWGWFDYGNTRFISIPERWNSSTTWQNWAQDVIPIFESAQIDYDINFIVTYGHQSAFTSAKGRYGGSGTLQNILMGLRGTFPKYKLDLSGHNHQYERYLQGNGLTTVINSTAGSAYRGWEDANRPGNCNFRAIHYGIVVLDFFENEIKGKFVCSMNTDQTGKSYDQLEEEICPEVGSEIDAFSIYGSNFPDGIGPVNESGSHEGIISFSTSPNPFRLSTNISFDVNSSGNVKIEIFNLEGQRIAIPENRTVDRGTYSFEWTASDQYGMPIPAGVYIAKMYFDNFNASTKLFKLN